jgi:hypothetical protein
MIPAAAALLAAGPTLARAHGDGSVIAAVGLGQEGRSAAFAREGAVASKVLPLGLSSAASERAYFDDGSADV